MNIYAGVRNLSAFLGKYDWLMVITAIALVLWGSVSIYSSSDSGDFFNLKKQLFFLGVGIFLMILVSFFDWRNLRRSPLFILFLYFLCLIGLAGIYFFAPEIRGIRGWYKIGPFSVDPIEPTKIVIILLLAKYFSQRHVEMYNIKHIILSGIYVGIPSILIFFHPDLGSILILGAIWFGILFISGIKIRHFAIILLLFLIIFIIGWHFALQDYQKSRIISFFAPQKYYLGLSWNQAQSKIAVGSGGLLGHGLGKGPQTQYGFLPESQTDFIFAAIAEEFGFLGVISIIILIFFLIWRILNVSFRAPNNFARFFALGFSMLIMAQSFINIGMNLGMLPIIGIPLPFVSYGGSGLIMMFAGLGFLQSIKTH